MAGWEEGRKERRKVGISDDGGRIKEGCRKDGLVDGWVSCWKDHGGLPSLNPIQSIMNSVVFPLIPFLSLLSMASALS